MPDSVSTLALRVESQEAVSNLKQFGAASTSLGGVVDALRGNVLALGAAFASFRFGKGVLNEAAEAQEAVGKYEQVLGSFARKADKTVSDLRSSFNYSKAAAQEAVSNMTNTFKKMGMGTSDALDVADQLLKRASDLAAFTNNNVEDVAEKLEKGLLGQSVPLKTLGITMIESTLAAEAAAEGIENFGRKTDLLTTIQTRLKLILNQTAAAEGQVARESDNYATKMRKLRGVLADFRTELGEALIPAATKLVSFATDITKKLETMPPAFKGAVVWTGLLGSAFFAIGKPILSLIASFKAIAAANVLTGKTARDAATATTSNTAAETANAAASDATVVSKNLEAAARTRNALAIQAENTALNSQSRSNIVSNATSNLGGGRGGSGTGFQTPLSKGAKRDLKMQWRAEQRAAKIGLPMTGKATGASAIGTLGKGAVGNLGKGASAAGKSVGTLGKAMRGLLKPLGSLASVFGRFGGFARGFLGIFGRLGGLLRGGVALIGGPITATIAAIVGGLALFKDGGMKFEAFLHETYPKIKEFTTEFGKKLLEGLKEASSKIGTWAKDLVVGGLKGMWDVARRLNGEETEATDQYHANKAIEAANARREALLAAEIKQRQMEERVLAAITDSKKKQLQADARYASSKNDDQTKYESAKRKLESDEAQQQANRRQQSIYENQVGELNRAQSALNKRRENLTANMEAELANAKTDEQKTAIENKYKQADAEVDNAQTKLDETRGELEDKMAKLAEDMGSLADSITEQKIAVDELAKTAEESAKAAQDDQKAFDKNKEDNKKQEAEQARQQKLASAKTHNERLEALQANKDAADKAVEESLSAQKTADDKNEQIKGINDALNNPAVAKQLAILESIAGRDDEQASYDYSGAVVALQEAGYDTSKFESFFGENSAAQLLNDINDQRAQQRKDLETLTTERDEAQGIADELSSRQSEQFGAQQAIDDENKAQDERRDEETKESIRRQREKRDKNRERLSAYNNEAYQRQLTAIEQSGSPWANYDKYDLVAAKGASDWAESQARLKETADELETLNTDIDKLREKEQAGTATDDDLKQLEEYESRRNELQSQYDSEYDKALQSRWGTEKELLGLEKTMQDEQDKQIRDYVSQQGDALKSQLEEQARLAEEEQQKRLQERSEVEKEQRQAVSGAKAIAAGTSEAFNIQSKIYDRGQENLPPEKKIEKSTEKIEQYVSQMKEQLYNYLSGNSSITLSLGY